MVHGECEGKQERAQSVCPFEERIPLGLLGVQSPQFPLRSSRQRPRILQVCTPGTSSGENERVQWVERGGDAIRLFLEASNVPRFDPGASRVAVRGQGDLAVRDEDLVGQAPEEPLLLRVLREERLGDAQLRRQLVEAAERADPRRVLAYPRTTSEGGDPTVTGAGIEPRGTRASGRQGNASRGDPSPWIGQYEMFNTSLCLASCRQSRQMNPLRLAQAIPSSSVACIPTPAG